MFLILFFRKTNNKCSDKQNKLYLILNYTKIQNYRRTIRVISFCRAVKNRESMKKVSIWKSYCYQPTLLHGGTFTSGKCKKELHLIIDNIHVLINYTFPWRTKPVNFTFLWQIFTWYGRREMGILEHCITILKLETMTNCHEIYS